MNNYGRSGTHEEGEFFGHDAEAEAQQDYCYGDCYFAGGYYGFGFCYDVFCLMAGNGFIKGFPPRTGNPYAVIPYAVKPGAGNGAQ